MLGYSCFTVSPQAVGRSLLSFMLLLDKASLESQTSEINILSCALSNKSSQQEARNKYCTLVMITTCRRLYVAFNFISHSLI